ncbi:hypothetical protein, partial [Phocaeicola barnesiae]
MFPETGFTPSQTRQHSGTQGVSGEGGCFTVKDMSREGGFTAEGRAGRPADRRHDGTQKKPRTSLRNPGPQDGD